MTDEDFETMDRARKIAIRVLEEMPDTNAEMTDEQCLVAGLAVLLHERANPPPMAELPQKCGWCAEANGGDWSKLTVFTLDEVRAHALVCEHNPLVQQLNEVSHRWRVMGIALGEALDQLEVINALDYLEPDHYSAKEWIAQARSLIPMTLAVCDDDGKVIKTFGLRKIEDSEVRTPCVPVLCDGDRHDFSCPNGTETGGEG